MACGHNYIKINLEKRNRLLFMQDFYKIFYSNFISS